jgi:hypothetical protein
MGTMLRVLTAPTMPHMGEGSGFEKAAILASPARNKIAGS